MSVESQFQDRVTNATTSTGALPVFTRLPRAGERCPYTGLSRSYICDLIKNKEVDSKLICRNGKQTGVRIVLLSSLLNYCNRAGI